MDDCCMFRFDSWLLRFNVKKKCGIIVCASCVTKTVAFKVTKNDATAAAAENCLTYDTTVTCTQCTTNEPELNDGARNSAQRAEEGHDEHGDSERVELYRARLCACSRLAVPRHT